MRTYRSALLVVLAVVAGLGAAFGVKTLTAKPAPVIAALRPGGAELPLAKEVRYAGGVRDGFTMQAPANAKVAKTSTEDAPMIVTAKTTGKKFVGLSVRVSDTEGLDPVAALTKQLEAMAANGLEVADVVQGTTFAGGKAAVADSKLAGRAVRDLYFVHEGALWKVMVITSPGDRKALDTGLAMLATWDWL